MHTTLSMSFPEIPFGNSTPKHLNVQYPEHSDIQTSEHLIQNGNAKSPQDLECPAGAPWGAPEPDNVTPGAKRRRSNIRY
jgi:hypothetical protein